MNQESMTHMTNVMAVSASMTLVLMVVVAIKMPGRTGKSLFDKLCDVISRRRRSSR